MISTNFSTKNNFSLQHDSLPSEFLVLNISLSGFEVACFSKKPFTLLKISELSFQSPILDFQELNNYLIHFLNENQIHAKNFKQIYINWIGCNFTLIPSAFYSVEQSHALLEFNIGKVPNEQILTCDVEDIKLIFSVPKEIKNTIDKLFPSHNFKHIGYHSIKTSFKHFQLKNATMIVLVYAGCIEIIIKNDSKIELYNVFKVASNEDILYYTLFSLEQFKLNPEVVKVVVAANSSASDELINILKKYIRNIELAIGDKLIIRKEEFEKIPNHYYFSLLNRIVCE